MPALPHMARPALVACLLCIPITTTALVPSADARSRVGTRRGEVIRGTGSSDRIFGELGNDRLYGNAGNDAVDGGFGSDRMYGGIGNDVLKGDIGEDKRRHGSRCSQQAEYGTEREIRSHGRRYSVGVMTSYGPSGPAARPGFKI